MFVPVSCFALWRCYLPFNGFLGVLWVFPRFRSLAASRGVFGACRGHRLLGLFLFMWLVCGLYGIVIVLGGMA